MVPSNTEWAFGKTSDGIENLDFHYFLETVEVNPPSVVDQDMVLKIIPKDIYIDIKFTSWTSGDEGGGGGFSYIRSTNPFPAGTDLNNSMGELVVYPNPASRYVHFRKSFSGNQILLELYDSSGSLVLKRAIKSDESIPVDQLNSGMYFTGSLTKPMYTRERWS